MLFVVEEMDHEYMKKNATMMSKRGPKTKNKRITMNMNRKRGEEMELLFIIEDMNHEHMKKNVTMMSKGGETNNKRIMTTTNIKRGGESGTTT